MNYEPVLARKEVSVVVTLFIRSLLLEMGAEETTNSGEDLYDKYVLPPLIALFYGMFLV